MKRPPLPIGRVATLTAGIFLLVFLLIELSWGRPAFCPCGHVALWAGDPHSAENSQQIADWYSPSHIIHGFLFYGAAWLALPAPMRRWALPIAVLAEGGWELLENSPIIIDRYRAVTIAYGYSGDSILNSMSDIAMMVIGFWLARRLPVAVTVALAIGFELLALAVIRDNLTLNVLMLAWPIDAVRAWQAG